MTKGSLAFFLCCVACSVACSSSGSSSGTTPSATSTTPSASPTSSPSSSGDAAAPASGGATAMTGTLGKLGDAQPIVSSLFISNSGETLVYLSSGAITCEMLTVSRWLGSAAAGTQVVEIVIRGAPVVGADVAIPPGEANYAAGGKSSAYEVNAATGSITFTKYEAKSVVEGKFQAGYADGNELQGTFHADFCDGGQDY